MVHQQIVAAVGAAEHQLGHVHRLVDAHVLVAKCRRAREGDDVARQDVRRDADQRGRGGAVVDLVVDADARGDLQRVDLQLVPACGVVRKAVAEAAREAAGEAHVV